MIHVLTNNITCDSSHNYLEDGVEGFQMQQFVHTIMLIKKQFNKTQSFTMIVLNIYFSHHLQSLQL